MLSGIVSLAGAQDLGATIDASRPVNNYAPIDKMWDDLPAVATDGQGHDIAVWALRHDG